VITDKRKVDRGGGTPAAPAEPELAAQPKVDENAVLLAERTADLQRLQAEYANYRKRADRERLAAGEVATGRVLADFLPVLDNLDRARAHGDLTGGLKAVADQLDAIFSKLGLVAFGEVGDRFDPVIHEAVLHDESDAVDVATCTTIMRPGYQHNDRLIRPAMVGVSDPAHPSPETLDVDESAQPPLAETTLPPQEDEDPAPTNDPQE
jgi:molecular chaperone GrpE